MPNRNSYSKAVDEDILRTISSNNEKPIPLIDRRDSGNQESEWLLPGEKVQMKEKYVGYQSHNGKIYGSAWITNYRLRFQELHHAHGFVDDNVLDVPLGSISKVEKKGRSNLTRKDNSYGIQIKCKDMRKIIFYYNPENHSRRRFYDKLIEFAFPYTNKKPFFATSYSATFSNNGWKIFDTRKEFNRQGVPNENWDFTTINAKYEFASTYPALLALPRKAVEMGESWISQAADYRSKKRLPVLSWYDQQRGVSICRGAQPLVGVTAKRSADDEALLQMIADANPHRTSLVILDARPLMNAAVNRAKGGGYEEKYKNCEFYFIGIDNIHVIRDSLKRVKNACYPRIDMGNWSKIIDSTNWLNHIQTIMSGAKRALVAMVENKQSVFIHCSDGWDRTAQLTSLTMIQIDSYYRTLDGFIVLIEKEWCSFGHKFAHRIGHGENKPKDEERSPIFVQFIDCVWQLYNQFSSAFEFNVNLLKTILDELYTCRFGTFLYNSEKERNDVNVRNLTVSLWSYVLENKSQFLNPNYNLENTRDAEVFLSYGDKPMGAKLWVDYYCRYNPQVFTQEFSTNDQNISDNGNDSSKFKSTSQ
ncbi:Phosphatidylinositol-3,5-bisphosphate 3-phosphatase [Aphelenchoides besseyi]|nr:Phosphatidylinositol-3,5-bisphosphate 3-phosphatase [Aphelenchoides besseyi]KAI6208328.1 Phosphatidylinositol-3,5-bisphosphate 3-phosphatase [Aphelenchoides besseyi]